MEEIIMINRKAFTMIELLIALSIISGIMIIAIPEFRSSHNVVENITGQRDAKAVIDRLLIWKVQDKKFSGISWDNYYDSDNDGFLDTGTQNENTAETIFLDGKKVPWSQGNEIEIFGVDCNELSNSDFELRVLVVGQCLNDNCDQHPMYHFNSCTDKGINKGVGWSYE
jgi:prepilin-type N-terminal cleavage/methylation domain-containing protein